MHITISALLDWIKPPLRVVRSIILNVPYYGWGRWCPVCEHTSRKFRRAGTIKRDDAKCIHCGSLERHRFVWLFFKNKTNLFDGRSKKVLHIAPEACFQKELKNELGDGYVTADLYDPHVMVQMDITNINFPDQAFDVIYCSHVLEHVKDDKKAMSEFHRILKDDGWAVLLVPITVINTFENSEIQSPSERKRVFGQEDHVRRYGLDFIDRLANSGFKVTTIKVSDMFMKKDAIRMGLTSETGDIYLCTKSE